MQSVVETGEQPFDRRVGKQRVHLAELATPVRARSPQSADRVISSARDKARAGNLRVGLTARWDGKARVGFNARKETGGRAGSQLLARLARAVGARFILPQRLASLLHQGRPPAAVSTVGLLSLPILPLHSIAVPADPHGTGTLQDRFQKELECGLVQPRTRADWIAQPEVCIVAKVPRARFDQA